MDLIHESAVHPILSPSMMKCDISRCAGCGESIHDQYIFRVAPDLEWHASCLKCEVCQQFLDETHTCFVHQGRPICKEDYIRTFRTCAKCKDPFGKEDVVMRARRLIYHVGCFRCSACDNKLNTGDEFGLRDRMLFCKTHFDVFPKSAGNESDSAVYTAKTLPGRKRDKSFGKFRSTDKKRPRQKENADTPPSSNDGHVTLNGTQSPGSGSPHSNSDTVVTTGTVSAGPNSKHGSSHGGHHRGKHSKETKTTRVRTVLNEKQLATLRHCYNQNPRPDALMKERLVDLTQLSPRVIRVWFQNKRCKDKKKSILMKQIQQQEKNGQRLAAIQGMQGVSMVAGSPVRHAGESHLQLNPIDVRNYHQAPPAWKALSDFAMQNGFAMNDGGNMPGDPGHDPAGAGAFQQLMHGFADPSMNGILHHGQDYNNGHGGGGLYDLAGEDSYQHAPNSVSSSTIPSDLSSPSGSTD